MTEAQDKAITRACQHECLMREMVEALEGVVKAWDEMFYPNDYGGYEVSKSDAFEAYRAFDNARAALARAKEQQQ